ncbi:MbcA/ParS/Xre antitoxin family protein [Acinetobacter johnsonii]|uniref:MbcA/ParS/Xre antitoxin family protein n=1 Tax=Acinetobacter johnsonii TaxID=40214 RepID=UPI0021683BF5|nr:MbcA/ParS/Xre antitoxin family protein [Acinetobacter johnsonii]MCS3528620.1 hypothetical protein [Acinetobacter johnsonii]
MDNKVVLSKTVLHAAENLGLTTDQLALILDIEKPSINLTLDPDSKPGKKALLLIQIFQSLDALNGGDLEWIQNFMSSPNRITGGIPIEQIQEDPGLVQVLECVQALLIK